MFMEMKTSCPRTAIGVDHRHRSRYYCRAHIQFMNLSARIAGGFHSYMSERERRRCVQFYVNKTGCYPSLSDITSARYAVWTVGIKSAPMAWRTKQNLARATMRRRSVQCVCLPSTFEITNLSAQKTRCERLFLRVGLCFYDERSRKVEKVLQVNFEMYQVYILAIYLSIYLFFLFDKQLNVFVYTQRKRKAFNKSKNKIINLAYSTC